MQLYDKNYKPVAFCSRTLNETEKAYAQIEKECLADFWACEKFDTYLNGLEFELISDHKPLIPLINTRDFDKVPIHCQTLLITSLKYSPKAKHIPSK